MGYGSPTIRQRPGGKSVPRSHTPRHIPDVIAAIVVGNEVLLRGEMSATNLIATHSRDQGAGVGARHLCRRLGVLAALSGRSKRGRFRHHPHFAVLGGFSDPGFARCRACGGDPQPSGRRHPKQGDRHRRIRLAERRPDARGRPAFAVQPGARHHRDVGAGAAREFPGQYYRGFRPALETRAGRSGWRVLGYFRPRNWRAEIQPRRRRRLRSSALGRCRRSPESCCPRWPSAPHWRPGAERDFPLCFWTRIAALAFLPAILFGWTIETVLD